MPLPAAPLHFSSASSPSGFVEAFCDSFREPTRPAILARAVIAGAPIRLSQGLLTQGCLGGGAGRHEVADLKPAAYWHEIAAAAGHLVRRHPQLCVQ